MKYTLTVYVLQQFMYACIMFAYLSFTDQTEKCFHFRRLHLLRFIQSDIGREYGTVDVAGHPGDRRTSTLLLVLVRRFWCRRVGFVADHETRQQFRRDASRESES